jgi:NAD(P)H-nitrite reductase large subunit
MTSSADTESVKESTGFAYVAGAARQVVSAVDSVLQTKVPLVGAVGDVVQSVASRIPVAGSVFDIAKEAAVAVDKASQPGLTHVQKASSLSKSLFGIAVRRHPLYGAFKVALFCIAGLFALLVALSIWWWV